MKLFIEGEPAPLWRPLGLFLGLTAACLVIDILLQTFLASERIYTLMAFTVTCVSGAIIWCWYAHVSPMHRFIETTLSETEAIEALQFYQSVGITREQLERIAESVLEAKADIPFMNNGKGHHEHANPLI